MKTLLLVRHAKTHSNSDTGKDFDRMLTDRGNRDAINMAQYLIAEKVQIDVLVTSTAKRALETAAHFSKAYKDSNITLIEKPELYHAPPPVYVEVIESLNNDWKRAAIVAHNNGITDMANELGVAHVDDMPTCSVFAITADTSDWKQFAKAEKRFLFFFLPKTLLEAEKK